MEGMHPSASLTRSSGRLQSTVFWMVVACATVFLYWFCLRFVQPGYFAPLSPYHIDFYDYAGMRIKAASDLLLRYPRPVAFLAMKLLGYGGLAGSMAGAIAIALLNLLLTVLFVRRQFGLYSPWLLPAVLFYLLLNIAHPEFYAEHRHDLPAQVSYLFLFLGLLAWQSWVQRGGGRSQLLLAIPAIIAFAFAKETYFASAICLLAAMAVTDRSNRSRHAWFIGFVLAIEVASLMWTRHINSPFVNINAAVDSTYRIDLSPLSILRTFLFYVYHLLTPGLVIAVIGGLWLAFKDRVAFVSAVAFPIAAFAALAPHTLLPNHRFEEYAWAGAPLMLVPILFFGSRALDRRTASMEIGALAVCTALAVAGPNGYIRRYDTNDQRYVREQEKFNQAILRSFDRLRSLPDSARILLTGLESPMVPWQVTDFIRQHFGENRYWTIAVPPKIDHRSNSTLIVFEDAAGVRLENFDYVAMYRRSGELAEIRPVDKGSVPEHLPASWIPQMVTDEEQARLRPTNPRPLFASAKTALRWGFPEEAARYLESAKQLGGDRLQEYSLLIAQAAEMKSTHQRAVTIPAKLFATPAHIVQPDGSGLGVTEVSWEIPDGLAVEVHVDAPDGPMLASASKSGRGKTDKWVHDGMQFFLQNVSGGKPLTKENTLATVKVHVTR
jgi:hypothetical protein